MAITVTRPISAPTGLTATLQSGGSLKASTTYYFVVIAYNTTYQSAYATTRPYHSDISAEGTFTTDTTNKSVLINWTNSAEHDSNTRYDIFITETSGDYTSSRCYGCTGESMGSITSGTTGYTITAASTQVYACHSCQSKNALPGGLSKDIGTIKVYINGETRTNGLSRIYSAIVAAGFSSYVYWDGYRMVLKGWIETGGTSSGEMLITAKELILFKGGIYCANPNQIIRFGSWTSDVIGADYINGCNIDILNSRYPLKTELDGVLKIYGSRITLSNSLITLVSETTNQLWYSGGASAYLSYNVSEIKDDLTELYFRGTTSIIKDIKCGFGNNLPEQDLYRLKIISLPTMAYKAGHKIYACEFLHERTTGTTIGLAMYRPAAGNTYYTDFYDCNFNLYTDNIPKIFTWIIFAPQTIATGWFQFNYSLKLKVLDINGDPIDGATISVKDKDGNAAVWIENDGTYDKAVTGTTYTTDRTTDSDGEIDYYLQSYKMTHDTSDPGNGTDNYYSYASIKTDKYPYTMTISKSGYKTYKSTFDHLGKNEMTITLEKVKNLNFSKHNKIITQ